MAVTYEPIATTTISGSSTSTITFSSITGTYTDLVLIAAGNLGTAGSINFQFNSDTTSNYSITLVYGDGTSALSTRTSATNLPSVYFGTGQSNGIVNIQNYANTTTYKTVLSRSNNADGFTSARVGLWRKTPEAITSITLTPQSGNFVAGSTFTLYGIKAA